MPSDTRLSWVRKKSRNWKAGWRTHPVHICENARERYCRYRKARQSNQPQRNYGLEFTEMQSRTGLSDFCHRDCKAWRSKLDEDASLFLPLIGKEEAKNQVEYLLHQSPRQYGLARTRWRIQDVGRALRWLEGCSESGMYKALKRLGFSRNRAMNFIHSPDPGLSHQDELRQQVRDFLDNFSTGLDRLLRYVGLSLD